MRRKDQTITVPARLFTEAYVLLTHPAVAECPDADWRTRADALARAWGDCGLCAFFDEAILATVPKRFDWSLFGFYLVYALLISLGLLFNWPLPAFWGIWLGWAVLYLVGTWFYWRFRSRQLEASA